MVPCYPPLEVVIRAYKCVSSSFGLTVNSSKTKHMVTGRLAAESDRAAIQVEGGTIECVKEFSYLGSQVDDSGRIDGEVERRIGLSNRQQWEERISKVEVRKRWGDQELDGERHGDCKKTGMAGPCGTHD